MQRKYRFFAVISVVCVFLSIFSSLKGVSQTPSAKVQLVTNPPIEKIIPFRGGGIAKHQEPVTLSFQALDVTGKPIKDAKIGLEILTPSPTPFWTTDFPIVEGTKLLKMETTAPEGKLKIQEMLPIRGRYQFKLNVAPLAANTFQPYEQTLSLNVSENPVKIKYLAVTAAILFAVGLLGGLVIGGQQELQPGEIAPYRVRLLLSGLIIAAIASLLFINITAEVAEAHGGEKHKSEVLPAVQKVQGLDVRLEGSKAATVGKMSDYSVQVKDGKTGENIKDVVFQVQARSLEDNLPIFGYKGIPDASGKLTWQQQFFDGAPHKIQVEATPSLSSNIQFAPVKVEQEVEVEGIAPPLYIRLVSLFYFTAIVGIGMAIGLWLKLDRRKQAL
jgi:hypothetical protein